MRSGIAATINGVKPGAQGLRTRALLLVAGSPFLALFALVTLHLETLARKQFLIEPTNVRHGRALGQAESGWQFHWFHPATLLTSS